MPKSLSDVQKKEMAQLFKSGFSLEDIVKQYGLKKPTIKKHLKTFLGESEFNKISKNVGKSDSFISVSFKGTLVV